jgi:hypothetical protein
MIYPVEMALLESGSTSTKPSTPLAEYIPCHLPPTHVLVAFMPAEANVPDPPARPSRSANLLGLVRKLIDYGRELAATLHQRAATDLRSITRSFGASDLALILVRIQRGLLRASALEARLEQSAVRLDAERKPRSAPALRTPRPALVPGLDPGICPAAPRAEAPDAALALPTEAEIAAWVRRRPIGAVIADICRDLGILPSHPLWRELQHAIIQHGGSHAALYMDIIRRSFRTLAPDWPASPLAASQVPAPACARPP